MTDDYHNYIFKQTGKIVFDPVDLTKKHVRQSEWKKSAIVLINDPDFCAYYSWFIKKRYNLELQRPLRGVHFTVINDKVSDNKKYQYAKEKYNNRIINLEYSVDPRIKNKNWWVGVKSDDAEKIRLAAGLESKPYWGFHLTIGRINESKLIHNEYIEKLINEDGNSANKFYIKTLISKGVLKYKNGKFI